MPRWNQSISVRIDAMLYRNRSSSPRHGGYTLFECKTLDGEFRTVYVEVQKGCFNLYAGHFIKFTNGIWAEDTSLFKCKSYETISDREIPENTRYVLEKLKFSEFRSNDQIDQIVTTWKT